MHASSGSWWKELVSEKVLATFPFVLLLLALSLTPVLAGCGGEGGEGDPSSGASAQSDEERAAVAEELRAEEEAAENLVFRPLDLPPADFSQAPMETEPNDRVEEATPLGPDLMVRGTFTSGDYDHYVFTSKGEPQLWIIEASGVGLRNLSYRDPSGDRQLTRNAEEGIATLSNLYLPPGTHHFHLRGDSATYTFRAVPLGPPDPYAELEPNDDRSRAHLLRVGRSRLGYLSEKGDEDWYRFSLKNPELLRLTVTPPQPMDLRVDLLGDERQIVRLWRGDPQDSLVYTMQLPLGDYHVRLLSQHDSVATLPYRIHLERLDPFQAPTDVEPNNEPNWARPLPPDLVIRGELGPWDDTRDYYRLPVQSETARIVFEGIDLPEGRPLDRIVGVMNQREYRVDDLEWNEEDSTLVGEIPADTAAFVRVTGAEGAYAFRLQLDPGPTPQPASSELALEAAFPRGPHTVAAFWPDAQRLELPLQLQNTSDSRQDLSLSLHSTDSRWEPRLPVETISLEAGETRTVPVAIQVDPDAWGDYPVQVTVQAEAAGGGFRTAAADLIALCEAPPIRPELPTPLPPEILGGINVGWSRLGAVVASENSNQIRKESILLDGLTPYQEGLSVRAVDLPWDLDLRLAGEEEVAVVGIVLNPDGTEGGWARLRDFELWLSRDGREYNLALASSLTWHPEDQAFLLPQPTPARFARLRLLRPQAEYGSVTIAEWKVIASPGTTQWEAEGVNLADPELGGYVVWSDPLVSNGRRPGLLAEDEEENAPKLDDMNSNEWVIGFHHDRAARIRGFEWIHGEKDGFPFLDGARISVSTGSPLGPWTPLGEISVEPVAGATARMELPEPVWARYVKLTVGPMDAPGRWFLPEIFRVFEAPATEGYRSILGEWGKYSRTSAFERLSAEGASLEARAELAENDNRDDAQEMASDTPYQGSVRVGEDTDWYRVEVPSGHNRLRFVLRGMPSIRTALTLEDREGNEIPLELVEEPEPGVLLFYEAQVEENRRYSLKVEEPPRSIALIWDNSGSVTPFKKTLYPSLLNFSEAVLPGREFVNVLPFMDSPSFLMEEWSDQPYEILQVLNDYDRQDGSSNAEENLRYGVEKLMGRKGTKAIVILTDANSPGFRSSLQLWDALAAVRPSIFSMELHRGNVSHQQDVLQSWSGVNAGRYDYFRTGADLDVAFQRATCMIRRPARYELIATTRFEAPPPPGFLAVNPSELELNAVELILDASGSMLQRMEGRRRIEIARDVLSDLVQNTIPEGTPLALRIFGHKTPDACDTDLEIPVQPLDREAVTSVIRRTEAMNLAKTPIGESLSLVAEDLAEVTGQKLIMLITDGEETCDGDPAAEIRALKEAGHDIRVNIVGFAIDDEGLKTQFESWAREGGGLYLNASSGEELAEAVDRALRPKFQVLDSAGEVKAEGTVGLDSVELPVGAYTVRILTSPQRTVQDVRVESEQTTTVEMPGG